jgi:hypothetical protein
MTTDRLASHTTNFSAEGSLAKEADELADRLARHAKTNDEYGRVVIGQPDAMRRAAVNVIRSYSADD